MTGPEHYQQAERLAAGVTLSGTHPDGSPIVRSDEPQTIALAQVHATLALAAATALSNGGAPDGSGGGMRLDDMAAWDLAASLFVPEVQS